MLSKLYEKSHFGQAKFLFFSTNPLYVYCDEHPLFINSLFSWFLAEARKYNISLNFAGHSLKQVDNKLASMILASCHVKVALNCGAEDAELLAREIGINPKDIQSLRFSRHILASGKASQGADVSGTGCVTLQAPTIEEAL